MLKYTDSYHLIISRAPVKKLLYIEKIYLQELNKGYKKYLSMRFVYLDGFDWVTKPTVSNPIVLMPQVTHILPLLSGTYIDEQYGHLTDGDPL